MSLKINEYQKEKFESFLQTQWHIPTGEQLDLMLEYLNAAKDHNLTKMDEIYNEMENNIVRFLYEAIWYFRSGSAEIVR